MRTRTNRPTLLTGERGALSLEWLGLVVVLVIILGVLLSNAQGWGEQISDVVSGWISELGG